MLQFQFTLPADPAGSRSATPSWDQCCGSTYIVFGSGSESLLSINKKEIVLAKTYFSFKKSCFKIKLEIMAPGEILGSTGGVSEWWNLVFSVMYTFCLKFILFLPVWIRIRIRIHKFLENGSNLDPDPPHCFETVLHVRRVVVVVDSVSLIILRCACCLAFLPTFCHSFLSFCFPGSIGPDPLPVSHSFLHIVVYMNYLGSCGNLPDPALTPSSSLFLQWPRNCCCSACFPY